MNVWMDGCPVRDLYLWPDGRSVKNGLRGGLGSCAMVCALHVMTLLLRCKRLGVGRPIILEAKTINIKQFNNYGEDYHVGRLCKQFITTHIYGSLTLTLSQSLMFS